MNKAVEVHHIVDQVDQDHSRDAQAPCGIDLPDPVLLLRHGVPPKDKVFNIITAVSPFFHRAKEKSRCFFWNCGV